MNADITIFTGCQRQIFGSQIGQFLLVDVVFCLIAETDDCIVSATAQILKESAILSPI